MNFHEQMSQFLYTISWVGGLGGSRWEFMLNMYSVTSIFLAFSSSCHCNSGVYSQDRKSSLRVQRAQCGGRTCFWLSWRIQMHMSCSASSSLFYSVIMCVVLPRLFSSTPRITRGPDFESVLLSVIFFFLSADHEIVNSLCWPSFPIKAASLSSLAIPPSHNGSTGEKKKGYIMPSKVAQ